MIHKTLKRKLTIEQHYPPSKKSEWNQVLLNGKQLQVY